MLDDSMIDYMKRMQGRKVSVKLDKTLASQIEPKFKLSGQVQEGLDIFRGYLHNVSNMEPVVHILLSSYVSDDPTKVDIQNYLISYVPRYLRGDLPFRMNARRYDADNNGRDDEIALHSVNMTMEYNETIASIRRELYAGGLLVYRFTPNGKRSLVNVAERFEASWDRFCRSFDTARPSTYLNIHVIETTRRFGLDLLGVGRDMIKAAEMMGVSLKEMSWRDWSFGPWPSDTWYDNAIEVDRDGNETNLMPDFPQLILLKHVYFKNTDNPGWLPGPGSEFAKQVDEAWDGKWYTYKIPNLDIKEDNIDIVTDFNKFLVSMLGR